MSKMAESIASGNGDDALFGYAVGPRSWKKSSSPGYASVRRVRLGFRNCKIERKRPEIRFLRRPSV